MNTHTIEITPTGVRCTVCLQTWKHKPVSACPGVPLYNWESAPDGLLTKTQVRQAGRKLGPNQPAVGCLWGKKGWIWLYDQSATLERPAPTPAQLAAIAKANAARQEKLTCKKCGITVSSHRLMAGELCVHCDHFQYLADARRDASEWARALIALPESWVILDTETTGLDGYICQICIMDPWGLELFNALVNPQAEIEPGAQMVHGITADLVAGARTFSEIYPALQQVLAGKTVIAYNADFDWRVIRRECARSELPKLPGVWDCAMEQYAAWVGEWSEYHESFTWQPLPGGDHTAAGDCRATLELIRRMAAYPDRAEDDKYHQD